VIQKELVDPIAARLLEGEFADGEVISVSGGEGQAGDRQGPAALRIVTLGLVPRVGKARRR
jgi:hypothetical protein